MTTSIEYTAYLAPDFLPEDQIDPFGYARLREKAREQGLVLDGEVTRVEDTPVTGVPTSNPDGTVGIAYVEIGSPQAGGETEPEARRIRWSINATPTIAVTAIKVDGEIGEDGRSAVDLPAAITEFGGLVEFKHGFTSEPEIHAYDADGTEVGYSYALALDDTRSEIMLPPGAAGLRAIPAEDDTEETP